jgi:hypothetical protein
LKLVIPGFLLCTEKNHVPAEIRTEQLPNADQKDYSLSQLAQSIDRLVVHDVLHVPRELRTRVCDEAGSSRPWDIIRSVWMQSAAWGAQACRRDSRIALALLCRDQDTTCVH